MTVASGFRAVVFALRDLPAADRKYITDTAQALRFSPEREPALWETPLLLARQSDTPPVPGLRTDAEVAASGPSVLLLAMRLLLADALQWPELRFLDPDRSYERNPQGVDYVLYAADPARWQPESLADALAADGSSAGGLAKTAVTAASWQIQRGLQPRPPRLPPVPGDRVPVLGLQVPMFGGRLSDLRDLRAAAASSAVPVGALPGHHQGRYALYLLIDDLPDGAHALDDEITIHLTLYRVDQDDGSVATAAVQLRAGDLSILYDAEAGQLTPAALNDWLAELLPSCLLVSPRGEVLLLDWFHLELTLRPEVASAPPEFDLRACGPAVAHDGEVHLAPASDGVAEGADPALLHPSMWSLPIFAELLAAADLTLSTTGRYLLVESAMPLDGELCHLSALFDTSPATGLRVLHCELAESDSPPPARVLDDAFPILRGEQAAPGSIA